jgi:hypothetical protein
MLLVDDILGVEACCRCCLLGEGVMAVDSPLSFSSSDFDFEAGFLPRLGVLSAIVDILFIKQI